MHKRLLLLLALLVTSMLTGCAEVADPTSPSGGQPVERPAATETVAATSTGESNPQTEKVTVPDVVGRGVVSARMVLGMNHLTFDIVTEPADADLPMDNSTVVTQQDPKPDEIVESGSAVTLTVKKK